MSTERGRPSLVAALVIMLVIAAASVGMLHVLGDAAGAWQPLVASGPITVTAIALCAGLHWLISASAWCQIVRAVSGHPLGLPASSSQIVLTALGKYVPGKVWGVGLRGVALRRCGVGLGPIAAASALEQTYLLASGVAVAALTLGAEAGGAAMWVGGVAAVIIWGLLASGSIRVWAGIVALLGRLSTRLAMPSPAPSRLLGVRLTATFTGVWLALGAVFTLVVHAMAAPSWSLPVTAMLVGSVTVSYLAGFAAFVPAGLGVREGVGTALLTTQGFGAETALTILIGFRLVTLLAEVVAAGLAARSLTEFARG